MSGINMYALAMVCQQMLGWSFNASVLISAAVVVTYTFLGGLSSSIYNEVLQFFLIIFGFFPLLVLGLMEVGGWAGLSARLPATFSHTWQGLGATSANPLGVEWYVIVMALMFIMGPSYWCTDFLLVQRALAAKNLDAARKTPLIAAFPKMLFPALVTLPGMIAIALMPESLQSSDSMVVFDGKGKFVRSWGKEFKGGAHGLHIQKEGHTEFLYMCDTNRSVVAKTTLEGEEVFTLGYPRESDKYKLDAAGKPATKYHPTNLAIAPNGDIYVGDGYGSNYINQYSKKGEFLRTFGGTGEEAGQLACPYGITVDTRSKTAVLTVADRSNQRLQLFTLDGKHLTLASLMASHILATSTNAKGYSSFPTCIGTSRLLTEIIKSSQISAR
jgi:hypothetical protein